MAGWDGFGSLRRGRRCLSSSAQSNQPDTYKYRKPFYCSNTVNSIVKKLKQNHSFIMNSTAAATPTTIEIPGLVGSWTDFLDNVENLDANALNLFPKKHLYEIFTQCSQIYHSAVGDASTKRNKAMKHLIEQKDSIRQIAGIDKDRWNNLKRFLSANLHLMFVVSQDEVHPNARHCVELLASSVLDQQSLLVRNTNATVTTRDKSDDTVLLFREALPTLFVHHFHEMKDRIKQYKDSVQLDGTNKNKLTCRREAKEGLLTIARKKIVENKFHVTDAIVHCCIDKNYPFNNSTTGTSALACLPFLIELFLVAAVDMVTERHALRAGIRICNSKRTQATITFHF